VSMLPLVSRDPAPFAASDVVVDAGEMTVGLVVVAPVMPSRAVSLFLANSWIRESTYRLLAPCDQYPQR
jgi:hypothetical protein